MAELERKDLISDEALKAPQVLTEEFAKLLAMLDKIKGTAVGFGTAFTANTSSTVKLQQATKGLTDEQAALAAIQKQIANLTAKNNDAYAKQQQLLAELKSQVKDRTKMSAEEAAAVTAQTSSIEKLGQALARNQQLYSRLRNEEERASKSGQNLLHIIQQQDKDFKRLNDSLGKHQAHVGGYKEEIEKLLPALKKINPELVEFGETAAASGKKLVALFASPLGIGLGALAATFAVAFKSVEFYIDNTVDGADRANIAMSRLRATGLYLKSTFKDIGKSVFDTFVPEDNKPGILDKLAVLATGGGLAPQVFEAKMKKVNALTEKQIELAKLQNDIKKEEIIQTVELARLELDKAKATFDAQDKLLHTAEERYEANKKAGELSDEQTKVELEGLDNVIEALRKTTKLKEGQTALSVTQKLLDGELNENGLKAYDISYEKLEALSKLEAQRYSVQTAAFQESRNRQKREIQLVEEAVQKRIDAEKLFNASVINLDKAYIMGRKQEANLVIGYQQNSLDEQLDASKDFYAASIEEVQAGTASQLQAIKDAALSRVVLESEVNRKIFEEAGDNLTLRANLLAKAREDALSKDQVFINESVAISQEGENKKNEILRNSTVTTAKILSDRYDYFRNLEKQQSKELLNQEISNLNKRFGNGGESYRSYLTKRAALTTSSSKKEIAQQLDEYQQQIAELQSFYDRKLISQKDYEEQSAKLTQAQSDLLFAQSESDVSLKLEAARRVKDALIELEQQSIQAIIEIGNSRFEADQAQINSRIQQLQDQKDLEIKLAGDNADAKVRIETEYTKKVTDQQRLLRESQRKQAIFQKALAVTQIGINTALAIVGALAPPPIGLGPVLGIPLASVIGALGAVQLAVALTKPIPAFADGTKSSPEGLALVGERGAELLKFPGGGEQLVTGPSIVDLPRGTEVLTNQDTVSELAIRALAHRDSVEPTRKELDALRKLYSGIENLTYVVRTKKDANLDTSKIAVAMVKAHNWLGFVKNTTR